MALPLKPTVKPQLAQPKPALPTDQGGSYEPKLDGFRAIVFVDGAKHILQSRNGRPLDRYFPELRFPPRRDVRAGELVIAAGEHESFEGLPQRILPAESRVRMLAEQMPA